MKHLITTADDFGLNPGVNAAVVRAYRDGILRYTSLMVNRAGAQEAVRLAKENPGLGVGLHVELCDGNPALWGLRYFFSAEQKNAVEGRIRAQIEKMLAWGLAPTHADGHCNIHVHPSIFPVLAGLCREYGIPRLRLPFGETGLVTSYEKNEALARRFVGAGFRILGEGLKPYASGLVIPDQTFGLLRSGMLTEDYLLWLIRALPDGLTEIYGHPTADGEKVVVDRPLPGHHSISELEALLSPLVREALRGEGIVLESRLTENAPAPSH